MEIYDDHKTTVLYKACGGKEEEKLTVDFKDAGNVTFHCPGTPDVVLKTYATKSIGGGRKGRAPFQSASRFSKNSRRETKSREGLSVQPKSSGAAVAAFPPNFPTVFASSLRATIQCASVTTKPR